jgi:hypothetical protein
MFITLVRGTGKVDLFSYTRLDTFLLSLPKKLVQGAEKFEANLS